jgi:hypothetical protein
MGLYTIPQHIETSWREPPEYDDPLENVERPRERKPWKRDREAVRMAMRRAINERWQASVRDFGRGWHYATCRDAVAAAQNHSWHEVRRALWKIDNLKRMHFEARHEHRLRLYRYVRKPRLLRQAAMGWERGVRNPAWESQP